MQDSDTRKAVHAQAIPLTELQRALQQPVEATLSGDPETVLRHLPPGHGGVIRLPKEATTEVLSVRNAFRNAAARLRPETSDRGLLATASREEGLLVAIYFWYTGDAGDIPPTPTAPSSATPVSVPAQGQTPPATERAAIPGIQGVSRESSPAQPPQQAPSQRTSTSASEKGEPATAPAPGYTSGHPLIEIRESPPFEQEWSLAEAAAVLGVSVKTVRRAIKAERIPARLVLGPHGPEYRVDIHPLQESQTSGENASRPAPQPQTAPPLQKPTPSSARPGSSTIEDTMDRLMNRLESLEAELSRLRRNQNDS